MPDNPLARTFRDLAGATHQRLAQICTDVHFVVAGLPMTLKGERLTESSVLPPVSRLARPKKIAPVPRVTTMASDDGLLSADCICAFGALAKAVATRQNILMGSTPPRRKRTNNMYRF